jgi:hypothetical protein
MFLSRCPAKYNTQCWTWPWRSRWAGTLGVASGVLRAQPGGFELVASDPTVLRLVATLAEDVDAALAMLGIHA